MSPRLGYGPKIPLRTRPALAMDGALPAGPKQPARPKVAQDNPLVLLGALGGGALNAVASGINGPGSPLHFAADDDQVDQDEIIARAAAWLRERLDPDAIVKLVDALQKTGGEPTAMDSRLRSTSGFESRFPEAARIRIMD
jgi:hypothetical protein